MQIEPIAHIHTDFPTKFGVPRQSGLASELTSTIVFAPAYRNPDCLRGIADFCDAVGHNRCKQNILRCAHAWK